MSAIDDKYAQLGGPGGWVGPPDDEGAGSAEMALPNGGRVRDYRNASIYWHPRTGAHEVHGAIRVKWAQLGGNGGFLGYPMTDETGTPDGRGRFNHFEGGSIYWTPETNAHEVHGDIRQRWSEMGWERSRLGYPTSDERDSNVPGGRFSRFQGGSIFWTPDRRIDVRFNID
ncbi:MAG: LGFP repeat-containing protein [Acidimicrobiales bacterium]